MYHLIGFDAIEQFSRQRLEESLRILPRQGLQHTRKQPTFRVFLVQQLGLPAGEWGSAQKLNTTFIADF